MGCHLPVRVGARGRLGASHRGAGDWGRGDLRVALALSLAEDRAGRRRQPRAQWGSAGPLPSTSWIAARGARRKRPALVVKGFLSEAIRPWLLVAGSPLGGRGSPAAPQGPGLAAGGAAVEDSTDCGRPEPASETHRKVSNLAPGSEALRADR